MGRLEQDAGTVARVRVAAGGPAVGKVLDCRYGLGDDIVGFSAVDVDDCHDATGSSCNRRFVAAFNESMMLIQFCCSVPRNLMSKSHLALEVFHNRDASKCSATSYAFCASHIRRI